MYKQARKQPPTNEELPIMGSTFADRAENLPARYEWLVLTALLLCFLGCVTVASKQKPLWYDEIFTMLVATQPTLHRFALAMPAEGNPPLNTWLARLCLHLLGMHASVLRLPAMVGFAAALWGLYVFVRRECGVLLGLLAVSVLVSQPLWQYSFEARPYGLMLGCLMLTLVSWQSAARALEPGLRAPRRLALLGMAIGITATIFCHYIGLIEVGVPLLFGEGYRAYKRRSIDWPVVITAGVAALPFALVIPMSRRTRAAVTSHSPWVRPFTLAKLKIYLLGLHMSWVLVFRADVVLLLIVLVWLARRFGRRQTASDAGEREAVPSGTFGYSVAAAWGATVLIPMTWLVTLPAKGYFFCRYGIGSALGIAILLCFFLSQSRWSRWMAVSLLVFLGGVSAKAIHRELSSPTLPMSVHLEGMFEDNSGLPIVIGEPVLFPPVWWYAPDAVKSRLTFLGNLPSWETGFGVTKEPGVIESALMAERPVMPARLLDFRTFVRSGPHFLLYDTTPGARVKSALESAGCQVTERKTVRPEGMDEVWCAGHGAGAGASAGLPAL